MVRGGGHGDGNGKGWGYVIGEGWRGDRVILESMHLITPRVLCNKGILCFVS